MKILKLVLPILIILLAAYARFDGIDDLSLWHDEGNSLRLAERSMDDLIEATSHDIHPPGYYILLKFWITWLGDSEFSLRALSAFWSIIAVAATYALGKRLYTHLAGIIAAFLIAINPFAIYYAQEARMYAQLSAITVLSLWVLYGMLQTADAYLVKYGKPKQYSLHFAPWVFGLAFINTLGLYTHYMYPFTMVAQGLLFWWWTLGRSEPRARTSYVAANLFTLMMFQPWLLTAYDQITTWPSANDSTPFVERVERIASTIFFGVDQVEGYFFSVPLLLIVASGLIFLSATKQRPSITWRLFLPILWALFNVGALLISGAYRETNLKFLLPSQIAIALTLGLGASQFFQIKTFPSAFSRLHPKILGYGLGIFLTVIMIGLVWIEKADTDRTRSDYRGIAHFINEIHQTNDAIILNAPNQEEVFTYYYRGDVPIYPLPKGLGGDDLATETAVRKIIAEYSRVFLVLWGQQERDPNNVVQRTLDQNACVYEREWYGDVELVQYTVVANAGEENGSVVRQPVNIKFGDHITLKEFALSTAQAQTGDILCITLFWETDEILTDRYKISVQLLYPNGFLADQHDSEPANNGLPTVAWPIRTPIVDNHGITIKPEFGSGEYSLVVIVYDINNPSEAGRLIPETNPPNHALPLTTVKIIEQN